MMPKQCIPKWVRAQTSLLSLGYIFMSVWVCVYVSAHEKNQKYIFQSNNSSVDVHSNVHFQLSCFSDNTLHAKCQVYALTCFSIIIYEVSWLQQSPRNYSPSRLFSSTDD